MKTKLRENLSRIYLMIIGSGLITVSSGYGLVSAFKGNFLQAYISLIGFFSGYKVAQIGLHNGRDSMKVFKSYITKIESYSRLDLISFMGGSILITLGFIALTQSIIEVNILLAATSAVSMGSGYIIGHWAINNTLV